MEPTPINFEFNSLRERWMNFERQINEQLLIAESTNITSDFIDMIKTNLGTEKPRNINIVIYGPVRDGKSYTGITIGKMIQIHMKDEYGIHISLV